MLMEWSGIDRPVKFVSQLKGYKNNQRIDNSVRFQRAVLVYHYVGRYESYAKLSLQVMRIKTKKHVRCIEPFAFFSLQSANALSHFKMKLWKCVAIVLMLCGAALSVFLSRILLSSRAHVLPNIQLSSSLLSASASVSTISSNSSSSGTRGMIRKVRSANEDNSVISDCKLQSFLSQYVGRMQYISWLNEKAFIYPWIDFFRGSVAVSEWKALLPVL